MADELTPGESIKICVQSSDPDLPNQSIIGSIEDLRKKKQLLLLANEEIQEKAQIRAQTEHLAYLGQVVNSMKRPDGRWDIAVNVNRKLLLV